MSEAINDERKPLLPREDSDQPPTDDATTAKPPCCRCRPVFFVEPISIFFALGIFPLSIVSQRYTLDWYTEHSVDFFAGRNGSDPGSNSTATPCQANASHGDYGFQQYVQSEASQFGLYGSIVMGVPAVFVTVVLGAGSDRFGRRFAIIPPVFGVFASSLISVLVILTKSNVYWFFLANFISGCSGSFLSILMACYAYVADQTPPERRLFRILVVEMSLLISGIVSPIANGAVLERFGYFYPLLFVVVCSLINFIYVVVFFPRYNTPLQQDLALASDDPMHCQLTLSSILAVIWEQTCSMFNIFFKSSDPSTKTTSWRRLKLNLLMTAFFIGNLPTFDISVSNLFEMNSPLCWDLNMVGLFTGVSSAVTGVGALIVTPLFKFCHVSDIAIAIISCLASLATSVYKVFVQNTAMMFLTLSIAMLRILFIPSLRTLLSREVREEEQGALFGAIACLEVICMTIGTVIFNSIYSATLFISTGFVFLVMAVFYLVGCILVGAYAVLMKLDKWNRDRAVLINKPLGNILAEESA